MAPAHMTSIRLNLLMQTLYFGMQTKPEHPHALQPNLHSLLCHHCSASALREELSALPLLSHKSLFQTVILSPLWMCPPEIQKAHILRCLPPRRFSCFLLLSCQLLP